jgi:hypothetical protein
MTEQTGAKHEQSAPSRSARSAIRQWRDSRQSTEELTAGKDYEASGLDRSLAAQVRKGDAADDYVEAGRTTGRRAAVSAVSGGSAADVHVCPDAASRGRRRRGDRGGRRGAAFA